ncbi:10786_t:CDS:2, partial [Gigaspora rosea]
VKVEKAIKAMKVAKVIKAMKAARAVKVVKVVLIKISSFESVITRLLEASQVFNLETSENLYEGDNGTHKEQHLTDISGPLPHINEQIEFSINDTFPMHNKTDKNGCLTNLYYKCEFGGTYQPKKTVNLQNQRNKGTKKVNCTWTLNLLSATGFIRITNLHDLHIEHQLSPDTRIFAPINRQFSDECCEEIRHLVVSGRYDLSTIRSLLSSQREKCIQFCNVIIQDNTAQTNHYNFPLCLFVLVDNYNKTRIAAQALMPDETIESFQWVVQNLEEATGIPPRVLITDKDLSMKHCSPYKLGEQYSDFIKDFYQARNSLNESAFETRFAELLNKYQHANSYLQKLYSIKES